MADYSASIDDNDARVQYLGWWTLRTQDGPWTGSRVAILVNIPSGVGENVTADVRLDNGDIVPVRYKTISQTLYGMVLWDSGPIAFGTHKLELSNGGLSKHLRLDRFAYDPTDFYDPGRQTSSSTSNYSTTSASQSSGGVTMAVAIISSPVTSAINIPAQTETGSTSSTISTSSATTGTSPVPDARRETSRSKSISIREGVLVGVLATLIFLALLFWIFHRQIKSKRKWRKTHALWASLRDSKAVPPSASKAGLFPVGNETGTEPGRLERPWYPTEKTEKRGEPMVNPSVSMPRPPSATSSSLVLLQYLTHRQEARQGLGSSDSPTPSNSSATTSRCRQSSVSSSVT